jgi:hypothetical protein
MNYLTDWEKFTEIYNLDWKKYNNFAYDSVSLEYFPKEKLEINSKKSTSLLYKSEEKKIIYVPIPKNASSSIINSLKLTPIRTYFKETYEEKSEFSNVFFKHLNIPKKYRTGYKFFVITRDPKSRWVSGINEFLSIYLRTLKRPSLLNPRYKHSIRDIWGFDGDKESFRIKFLNELKNNKFIFDCHTRPQISWINFCSQYNLDITFLKLDENLNEKISNLLKKKVIISHDNVTEKYESKLKTYKFCHDILTNYCLKNKNFLDLYEMDFYLYNSSS